MGMANWKESTKFPHSQIRSSQFVMPVPKNPALPDSIAKLIGVPETARCLAHYRIVAGANEVKVIQQSNSKGVKHGDNLCIQVKMFWRQKGQDVVFTEYLDLIWETKLALIARPAKPFIEAQAKQDAVVLAKQMGEIIKKKIAITRQSG